MTLLTTRIGMKSLLFCDPSQRNARILPANLTGFAFSASEGLKSSMDTARWRSRFADFLNLLAIGDRDDEEWSAVVITHYPDVRLEEIRRELVRMTISVPDRECYSAEEVVQLRKWADELRR